MADEDRSVAELYHMIHPGAGDDSTVRSVFIIDPRNVVRLMLTYPNNVGRNFDEILRVIDALQMTDWSPVSTPVDWKPSERLIAAPTLSLDELEEKFDNVEEATPYLRYVDAPT